MKSIIFLIASVLSAQAMAFDYMAALKRYAVPCVASAGASYLLLKENQGRVAALGCSLMIVGGETLSTDPKIDEKFDQMDKLFTYKANESQQQLQMTFDAKVSQVNASLDTNDLKTREMIKNVMTDVAVLMQDQIYKKVQERLNHMDFVPTLKQELMEQIKLEVITEMKSRKGEMEDAVVEKVIKRVIAEPITVDTQKKEAKEPKK